MNKDERIYFDYSATTPMDDRVIDTMCDFMKNYFGNPSSIHSFGRDARKKLEEARGICIDYIGAQDPTEVVFTSGGTEADNMVLDGLVSGSSLEKPHIITTPIEHKAILEKIENMEKNGLVESTLLDVDKYGQVNIDDLKGKIKENTILVSIMYANNEVGSIQPIRDIGKYLEKINKKRKNRIYFHTDAVQAFGYLNCDVQYLHVDMLSMSSHKIHGPKGIGFLYIRKGVPIKNLISGGGQEFGRRAGTEGTASIIGLAKATEILKNEKEEDKKKIQKLRDRLIEGVLKLPMVELTGHPSERLPGLASFVFEGIEGESILINLDLRGIAVSTGSACTSGNLKTSHVLDACGYDPQVAQGNIRFSLGKYNTEEEVDRVLDILPGIIKKLQDMSPLIS